MNPNIDTSMTSSNSKIVSDRYNQKRPKIILIIAILLLLLISAGIYLSSRNTNNGTATATAKSYSFDKGKGSDHFAKYTLLGIKPNSGFRYSKPWNELLYANSPLQRSDPRFNRKKFVDKGNNVEFGQRFFSRDGQVLYLQTIMAARIVPKNQMSSFKPADNFAHIIAKYSYPGLEFNQVGFKLGAPSTFTNPSIENDAARYELTAFPNTKDYSGPIHNMKGELIEIHGKNANYYMMVVAIEDTWNNSPITWQKINDSLRVDQ